MSCVPCKLQKQAAAARTFTAIVDQTPEDCPYNEAQLQDLKALLICSRDYLKELNISQFDVNKALGIVVSAINRKYNFCYFRKQLDRIFPIILRILNSEKCQFPS